MWQKPRFADDFLLGKAREKQTLRDFYRFFRSARLASEAICDIASERNDAERKKMKNQIVPSHVETFVVVFSSSSNQ